MVTSLVLKVNSVSRLSIENSWRLSESIGLVKFIIFGQFIIFNWWSSMVLMVLTEQSWLFRFQSDAIQMSFELASNSEVPNGFQRNQRNRNGIEWFDTETFGIRFRVSDFNCKGILFWSITSWKKRDSLLKDSPFEKLVYWETLLFDGCTSLS